LFGSFILLLDKAAEAEYCHIKEYSNIVVIYTLD